MHRALLVCPGPRLRPADFKLNFDQVIHEHAKRVSTSQLEAAISELFEKDMGELYDRIDEAVIRSAYTYCHRNQLQTAKLLGVSRNVIRQRLAKYHLLPVRV